MVIYDYGSSLSVLDLNKKIIFSKTFKGKFFLNIEWSHDSTFFIATTETNLYMFNMYDFSNKQWSNFKNKIKVSLISLYFYLSIMEIMVAQQKNSFKFTM